MRTPAFPLVLACLLLPAWGLAAPPFPGGVIDSTGRTAYLATPSGIEAVDLARGELLWLRRDAHLPLLVAGDRLYALALSPGHELSVVAFDLAGRADRVFRADITSLPPWVVTRERPGYTFRCTWRLARSLLYLDWHASARSEASPPKLASGQLLIDLDSGRVQDSPASLLAPRPASRVPPQLEKLAVRWQGQTAEQLVAVVVEDLPQPAGPPRRAPAALRQERLVLRSWELRGGKESKPRELIRGTRLVVLPGLEGQHLWLRDAAPHPDEPGRDELAARHHWSVVSVLDGNLVARVVYIPGTQTATLIDRRAYCLATATTRSVDAEAPIGKALILHAVDLDTGKVAWRRPLGKAPAGKPKR